MSRLARGTNAMSTGIVGNRTGGGMVAPLASRTWIARSSEPAAYPMVFAAIAVPQAVFAFAPELPNAFSPSVLTSKTDTNGCTLPTLLTGPAGEAAVEGT